MSRPSYEHIQDQSVQGHPPLWRMRIAPMTGEVEIAVRPELLFFAEHRRAIDDLASALAMHLHGLTQNPRNLEQDGLPC